MSFRNDTDNPILIRGTGWKVGTKGYVKFVLWSVPTGRKVEFSDPIVKNVKPSSDSVVYTTDLAPGKKERTEFPVDGKDVWVTRTVTRRGRQRHPRGDVLLALRADHRDPPDRDRARREPAARADSGPTRSPPGAAGRPVRAAVSCAAAALRLAARAEPEQLQAVRVDPVAGLPPDPRDDCGEARVADVGRPAAASADDMVMVRRRLAGDVGVVAGRQVDPLDRPDALQDLERPEDRRPADVQPPRAGSRRRARPR